MGMRILTVSSLGVELRVGLKKAFGLAVVADGCPVLLVGPLVIELRWR